MADKANPDRYMHLPPRAMSVSVVEYERRNATPRHLTWGLDPLDERVIPPMPGDLITVLGRPGMGKTTLMIFMAKRFSELANQNLIGVEKPIFVYATWETMVEEFMGVFSAAASGNTLEDIGRGRADMVAIKRAMVKVLGSSVAVFGRSMEDARSGLATPTLFDLNEAITHLNDNGFNVVGVFIDYLQQIPGLRYDNKREDRSQRSSENLSFIKEMLMGHGAFGAVGCQARREVDDYGGLKFPTLSDGQWTSTIEQASDKSYGITVPVKYLPVGQEIELSKWAYEVTESMFGLKLLKQRFGPATDKDVWLLDFNMATAIATMHAAAGEIETEEIF